MSHVNACHTKFAFGDFQQSAQHLEGRRLACAVGTEQSENLTARHVKVCLVDGNEGTETTHQSLGMDHTVGVPRDCRIGVCDCRRFKQRQTFLGFKPPVA